MQIREHVHLDRVDLTPCTGSEIRDIDLRSVGSSVAPKFRDLVSRRGVLVFRNQKLDADALVRFGSEFGPLKCNAVRRGDGALPPEVVHIRTTADSTHAAGEGWHADATGEPVPPALSILAIDEAPPVGGDTMFVSMAAVFLRLSAKMQEVLRGCTAHHDGEIYRIHGNASIDYPEADHPVVVAHPVSGAPILYVNPFFTRRINEFATPESEALLRLLYQLTADALDAQLRVRWQPGTVVIWDNQTVQHRAIWDYHPHTRSGYRVTTEGVSLHPFVMSPSGPAA